MEATVPSSGVETRSALRSTPEKTATAVDIGPRTATYIQGRRTMQSWAVVVAVGASFMNSVPAPDSPAASRLRGVLRSWLQAWLPDASTPPEAPADEAAAAGVPAPASVRVLVVDDNPANLMLISAQMEAFGILPVLAADGAEAVALACELDFDLILMDLQMPILDGLGATSAIRRVEAAGSRAAVPVVAFAGTSPGPGMLAAHGISGSLIKPCDDQSLEECLVRWCPTYRAFAAGRQAALGDGLRAMARRNLGDSPGTPS